MVDDSSLERENRELRRANEILKAAAHFFGAELDRQSPSTEAAPTTALEPAPTMSTAPPAGFEPVRPGHIAATWLPSGYTQSDDPPYLRLSAPTQPADDIRGKVERDTSARVDRPESAVDVPVRGGTAWVHDVSAKDTTMLLFRDQVPPSHRNPF